MNRSPAYLYVLTALGGGPLHGLGIAEAVSAFTDGSVVLGPGTLYRCLADLDEDGLIRRTDAPTGEGGGGRKYYELTDGGRAELARAVDDLSRLVRAAGRGLRGDDPVGAST